MDALVIAGPTASGKTALALSLSEQYPIEIINMDSALVYRGMDIGTAKPSLDDRVRVPHHLIDIIEPHQSYSTAEFISDVERLIPEIQQRGSLPVVVGGTMMYLNSWREGLSVLPPSDPDVRARLQQAWDENEEAVYQRLAVVDALAAKRIHSNDAQRIIRALEVYELSGLPMSEQQSQRHATALSLLTVFMLPGDKAWLHQRIEARFEAMLADGFLSEVEKLKVNPLCHDDLPSIRSVGYRQAWSYLSEEIDFEEMKRQSLSATRSLAKRQMTWMRRMSADVIIHPDRQDVTIKDISPLITQYFSGDAGIS